MKSVAVLGAVTALFIIGYWASVLGGVFPVEELLPGYRAWFLSFPVADGWIALWGLLAATAAWRGREQAAASYSLLMGSGLVFLGLYAFTYGATTGLLCRTTLDEYVEIAIKVYCLVAGGYLTRWGLCRRGEPGRAVVAAS